MKPKTQTERINFKCSPEQKKRIIKLAKKLTNSNLTDLIFLAISKLK